MGIALLEDELFNRLYKLQASQSGASKNLEIKECLVLPEERASNPLVAPYRAPTVFCPSPPSRLQRHHQLLGELA